MKSQCDLVTVADFAPAIKWQFLSIEENRILICKRFKEITIVTYRDLCMFARNRFAIWQKFHVYGQNNIVIHICAGTTDHCGLPLDIKLFARGVLSQDRILRFVQHAANGLSHIVEHQFILWLKIQLRHGVVSRERAIKSFQIDRILLGRIRDDIIELRQDFFDQRRDG